MIFIGYHLQYRYFRKGEYKVLDQGKRNEIQKY